MTEHVAHAMAPESADSVRPYGLVAEFVDEHAILEAARRAYAEGYRRLDAYTPIPVEGLAALVGFRKSRIPLLMLLGGIVGLIGGFALQYWVHVINYPLNIGGKPPNSVPMWIPITFETTVLLAAVTGVLAMIVLNGLPAPYHPLFNVAEFARASQDRFFLAIEATDPRFDMTQTRRFLESLGPASVHEVLP
ncbi:MAG: hypothetical protein BWY52_02080 [Chloroflexi bacterium ADurb.Bin325]|nr:MAG: hypothetical protein BWY52_02080 [Chloroflexi bacterium ADurb.Bin325]